MTKKIIKKNAMNTLYQSFSSHCKEFLSILISSFSRESVINIAFECGVIRRMNKFDPWLLIMALMDCLSNQDHALCLSSIHEKYCTLAEKHGMTERKISWEVFHDHLSKKTIEDFIAEICLRCQQQLQKRTYSLCFDLVTALTDRIGISNILIQDGSIVNEKGQKGSSHKGIKENQKKIQATLSFLHMDMETYTITDANASERDYVPLDKCRGALLLADAGYVDKSIFASIIDEEGFFIFKGRTNCTYKILGAQKRLKNKNVEIEVAEGDKVNSEKFNGKHTYDLLVEVHDKTSGTSFRMRVIKYYCPERKPGEPAHVLFYTNIPSASLDAEQIAQLYRVRWQVELSFKIIKEFSGFIKVNTDRMHLRKALLKAAVIVYSTKQYIGKFLDSESEGRISHMKNGAYNGDTFREIIELCIHAGKANITNILTTGKRRIKESMESIVAMLYGKSKRLCKSKVSYINRIKGKDVSIILEIIKRKPPVSYLNDKLMLPNA